jgi:hypothetical protein
MAFLTGKTVWSRTAITFARSVQTTWDHRYWKDDDES